MELDYFKKFNKKTEVKEYSDKVWTYTRVSSKQQYNLDGSIDTQITSAKDYAKENGYTIFHEFGGTYESAKGDMTRAEFKKLINKVKNSKNKPFAILIYKVSRFSRTGGNAVGLLHELIHTHGVHLIEVTSGLNTTTETGEYEIMKLLLDAKKENSSRLEFTLPGMTKFVKNGNKLGKAGRGYDHYGPRVINPAFYSRTQRIEINNEGKLLKKAWKWKLLGTLDFEIRKKLEMYGLKITKQSMSDMWRNPFYCGIQNNSLLDGNPVKGNWRPLVSIKDFKTINETLDGNKNSGYKQSKYNDTRPLQSHLYCGICGTKMTGYKAKKKYDYYKCQNKSCSCQDLNANSSKKSLRTGLNDLFEDYLSQFCLSRKYVEVFKAQMKLTITDKNKESIELERSLSNQLKDLESQKDKLDRKFTFEDLRHELYEKFTGELNDKIEAINAEKAKLGISISNLDNKIENCVEVIQNISDYWKKGSIENKLRVQKLVFPSGIVIDPKKRQYRTKNINSVFTVIASISKDEDTKTKNSSSELNDESCLVAGTGLEPVTFGL